MGFFSWKCAKSEISIPAYPYAGFPLPASEVVLILPDNSKIEGILDGYSQISGVDVLSKISTFMFGEEDRDLVFNNKKYILEGNIVVAETKSFPRYDVPLAEEDFVFIKDKTKTHIIGRTLDEIKLGDLYRISDDFKTALGMIKMVRADKYNCETYDELPASKVCDNQGFSYSDEEREFILETLLKLESNND